MFVKMTIYLQVRANMKKKNITLLERHIFVQIHDPACTQVYCL